MPDQGQMAQIYRIGEKEIAKLAYELYEARGCVHGYDVNDWLDAEWELIEMRQNIARHGGRAARVSHAAALI
jgi:hypothetical protein